MSSQTAVNKQWRYSGFDSRQVFMVPKVSFQAIIGVLHSMKYKKREMNLQQCPCENLSLKWLEKFASYLFQKPSLQLSAVAPAVLLCSINDKFCV